MTLAERFASKIEVDAETGCWVWTASRSPTGYGGIWNGERPEQAHRVSYRLHCGEIPEGTEIDHLCRNRACVNPAHLEAVPHDVNMRRGDTGAGRNSRKSHCKRGHPLSGDNLKITPSGSRQCRECLRMHARNAKARRRGG